ncbi:MAG: TonB family protein [Variovorax sp.]|jgi:TonB family protein|nr:MAG: TonB family protein [Variovorax sp.]
MKIQRLKTCALALALCGALGSQGCATGGDAHAWPARIVASDQLRPAERLRLTMPRRNLGDPMPNGTAVLRVHVDELGIVRRTSLETSSGSAVLDGAAQRALVGARFVPYREAGEAMAVTTLMPVSVKAFAQCRAMRSFDC